MSFDYKTVIDHESNDYVSSPDQSALYVSSSCFHELHRSKITRQKPFERDGSDEAFAYMGNSNTILNLPDDLTKDLNETATPPNNCYPNPPRKYGKAGRIMNKSSGSDDPLDSAHQLQQQQQQVGFGRASSSYRALKPGRFSLGSGACSMTSHRRNRAQQAQQKQHQHYQESERRRNSIERPTTTTVVNNDNNRNFNTPKSNNSTQHRTTITDTHSQQQSSSIIMNDFNNCNQSHHKKQHQQDVGKKRGSNSSASSNSSIFCDNRNSSGSRSTTPQPRSSTNTTTTTTIRSTNGSPVSEIIDLENSNTDEDGENTINISSTSTSNRKENRSSNYKQEDAFKTKSNQAKRSYGTSNNSEESRQFLGLFSKVNGVKDCTQNPSRKKAKAIVPGASLGQNTYNKSSNTSSLDERASRGTTPLSRENSLLEEPIPRKNDKNRATAATSSKETLWNSSNTRKLSNIKDYDDELRSSSFSNTPKNNEQKSNGIPADKFHSSTKKNRAQSILETFCEKGKAMVSNFISATIASPSSNNRPVTRSSSRKHKKGDVVVIDDSDDDVQSVVGANSFENNRRKSYSSENNSANFTVTNEPSNQQQTRRKRLGERLKISLVRISIGEKVFTHCCSMQFQTGTPDPFLILCFSDSAAYFMPKEVHIPLDGESIAEMVYSLDMEDDSDDDKITFLAMKMELPANRRSGKSHLDKLVEYGQISNLRTLCDSYIVCEIRDELEFKEKLPTILENQTILQSFLTEEANIRNLDEAQKYISVLMQENALDKRARLESSQSPNRSRRRNRLGSSKTLSVEDKQKILLVFPFVGGNRVEKAAKGLNLCGGCLSPFDEEDEIISSEKLTEIQQEAASGRTHILTITGEDRERLEPGEFLNDTLIDFWMRWISRKEAPSKSCVHFFTSHFYTTLKEEGVNAVSSWTSRKGIDIFSKRIIFLPINQTLHWSLCAVINPGYVENFIDTAGEDSDNRKFPCIIFLDSLKAHQKSVVAKNVRIWLNHEWKKMHGGNTDVFTASKMQVFAPKVPYQYNSWDCGVFVCQYAYALYQQRHQNITYHDLFISKPALIDAITKSPFMQFDMDYIAKLRQAMGKLIDNLSSVYLQVKSEMAESKPTKPQPNLVEMNCNHFAVEHKVNV